MQKILLNLLLNLLLISGLLVAALPGAPAQSDTAKIHIGIVNVDFQRAVLSPGLWHLIGQAKITSDNYDLNAADIKITFLSGSKAGASGLRQAAAEGGTAPSTQVVAHLRRPLESESYEIFSDKALYLPDKSRPSGGRLTFTGHVKIITKSGFLAAPSTSTFDAATVLLGSGDAYPQIETGPGHITLTPAQ